MNHHPFIPHPQPIFLKDQRHFYIHSINKLCINASSHCSKACYSERVYALCVNVKVVYSVYVKAPRSKLSHPSRHRIADGDLSSEKVTKSMGSTAADNDRAIIFTYGTLKRGFSNHGLVQDMILAGDAAFLGIAVTAGRFPLVCGPYRVPFLINIPGAGERVSGELYAVSRRAIALMDELEGISRGHYEKRPITVHLLIGGAGGGEAGLIVEAEAYFAHQSFGEEMWRRAGEKGFCAYSSEEAVGYVKRKDRPQGITFLDQIRIFVSSGNDD